MKLSWGQSFAFALVTTIATYFVAGSFGWVAGLIFFIVCNIVGPPFWVAITRDPVERRQRLKEANSGTLLFFIAIAVAAWIGFTLWTWMTEPCLNERKLGIDCPRDR